MEVGILMCGLNGSGKSTLGKKLAEHIGFHFIDNEELFFPKTNSQYIYANPRSRREVEKLLLEEAAAYPNFIFAAVKGDYGEKAQRLYQCAILIDVPKGIRLERVKRRSFLQFGVRALPGGDLYAQEKAFWDAAAARKENHAEAWVQSLEIPILRADGTKPFEENIMLIEAWLQKLNFIPKCPADPL